MAKRQVKLNSTNQTIDIFVGDTSSTTGAGLTGLAFNSTGLKCFYRRGQDGPSTELVLASGLTPTGVYVRGGFCEIDNSGMKGLYRLGIPDESVGGNISSSIIYMYGATNMLPTISELEFTGQDITSSLYNTNVVTWSGTPHYRLFNRALMAGPAFDHLQGEARRAAAASVRRSLLARVEVPSDDWPYLYLSGRGISGFYLGMIAAILTLSVLAVAVASPHVRRGLRTGRAVDWEMLLFGLAFLLLETKAVADMSLLWGATWLTNSVVFGAILLTILAATLCVQHRLLPWPVATVGLVAALVAVYAGCRCGCCSRWVRRSAWGSRSSTWAPRKSRCRSTRARAYRSSLRGEHRDARYDDVRTDALAALTSTNRFSPDGDRWGGELALTRDVGNGATAYARVARGYRGGGVNPSLAAYPGVVPGQLTYADEHLWSYEAGLRFSGPGQRWWGDSALFWEQRSDMQVKVPVQLVANDPTSFVFLTDNADSGRAVGAELALGWRPADVLTLTGSLGLLDNDVRDFPAAPQLEGRYLRSGG